jgi:hypothetical protein
MDFAHLRRLVVLIASSTSLSAHAASLDPATFETTLAIGGSVTIEKTVTLDEGVPALSRVDVFFLADNTGSMGALLTTVKNNATTIVSEIAGGDPRFAGIDAAFGVARYLEDPSEGVLPTRAYQLLQAVTTDQTAVDVAINSWSPEGGGDFPEANFFALQQVATEGSPTPSGVSTGHVTGWRPDSGRVIVWFGDASSHIATISQAETIAALTGANVIVAAINTRGANSGIDTSAQATAIVTATAGTLTNNVSGTATTIDAILDAIEEATNEVDIALTTSGDTSGLDVDFLCTSVEGCSGVLPGESRTLDMTITALEPGFFEFTTSAVGIAGAVELDTITVLGDPDEQPPVCDPLVEDGNTFTGTARDDGEGDAGIQSISLQLAINMDLIVDPFTPGDPVVTFTLQAIDSTQFAQGTVVISDGQNEPVLCEEAEIFGDRIIYPAMSNSGGGWPEAIQINEDQDFAYIALRDLGVSAYDVSPPQSAFHINNFTPTSGECGGDSFFADEIVLFPDEIGISGGACGLLVVSGPNTAPVLEERIAIPGGEAEEAAVRVESEDVSHAYVAAWGMGLQIFTEDCSSGSCVISPRGSLGEVDPGTPDDPSDPNFWGYSLAIWVEELETELGLKVVAYVASTEGLQIIDVTNPDNPILLARFDTNPDDLALSGLDSVPQDIVVADGHAYLPIWLAGLLVIDVSNPFDSPFVPSETQRILVKDGTSSAFFKVEISERENRVYASEGLNGLTVFHQWTADGSLTFDSRIPIGVEDPLCNVDPVSGESDACWAWAIDESGRLVGVTYGVWPGSPLGGGFVLFQDTLGNVCGLLGIEPFLVLAPLYLRRRLRRRRS